MIVVRTSLLTTLLVLACALEAPAQDATSTTPRVDVDREKPDARPPRTLRFLRENQLFLRAQLDQLRTRITWTHGDARDLTEHERWLQGLGQEQHAAFDSLAVERQRLARRTLLQRIEELGAIEDQLDRIEALLAAQSGRLDGVESDYVHRQETALAVLATGLPAGDPVAIRLDTVDGGAHRVALDAPTRAALRTGAIAQLLHDFVEPRATELRVAIEFADGRSQDLGTLHVDPTRDRLTFVQIALDRPADADGALAPVVWER